MLTLDQRFPFENAEIAWGRIGDGPPLVLIHGFPWSAQAWRRIAPWLAQTCTVYVFDMAGTGRSGRFEGQDVRPQAQSRLLAALVRAWGLDRPEIVAHDFGGLAALRGWFVEGLRYRALTLIDAVGVLPSGSPFFAHVRDHEAAFAGLPEPAHAALFQNYIQSAAARPLSDEAKQIYLAPYAGDEGRPAFYRQIAQSNDAAIAEAAARYAPMEIPTRLIWGGDDRFIPVAQGRELAAALCADRFTEVPGAGHAIQEDAPEALVGLLLGPDGAAAQAA